MATSTYTHFRKQFHPDPTTQIGYQRQNKLRQGEFEGKSNFYKQRLYAQEQLCNHKALDCPTAYTENCQSKLCQLKRGSSLNSLPKRLRDSVFELPQKYSINTSYNRPVSTPSFQSSYMSNRYQPSNQSKYHGYTTSNGTQLERIAPPSSNSPLRSQPQNNNNNNIIRRFNQFQAQQQHSQPDRFRSRSGSTELEIVNNKRFTRCYQDKKNFYKSNEYQRARNQRAINYLQKAMVIPEKNSIQEESSCKKMHKQANSLSLDSLKDHKEVDQLSHFNETACMNLESIEVQKQITKIKSAQSLTPLNDKTLTPTKQELQTAEFMPRSTQDQIVQSSPQSIVRKPKDNRNSQNSRNSIREVSCQVSTNQKNRTSPLRHIQQPCLEIQQTQAEIQQKIFGNVVIPPGSSIGQSQVFIPAGVIQDQNGQQQIVLSPVCYQQHLNNQQQQNQCKYCAQSTTQVSQNIVERTAEMLITENDMAEQIRITERSLPLRNAKQNTIQATSATAKPGYIPCGYDTCSTITNDQNSNLATIQQQNSNFIKLETQDQQDNTEILDDLDDDKKSEDSSLNVVAHDFRMSHLYEAVLTGFKRHVYHQRRKVCADQYSKAFLLHKCFQNFKEAYRNQTASVKIQRCYFKKVLTNWKQQVRLKDQEQEIVIDDNLNEEKPPQQFLQPMSVQKAITQNSMGIQTDATSNSFVLPTTEIANFVPKNTLKPQIHNHNSSSEISQSLIMPNIQDQQKPNQHRQHSDSCKPIVQPQKQLFLKIQKENIEETPFESIMQVMMPQVETYTPKPLHQNLKNPKEQKSHQRPPLVKSAKTANTSFVNTTVDVVSTEHILKDVSQLINQMNNFPAKLEKTNKLQSPSVKDFNPPAQNVLLRNSSHQDSGLKTKKPAQQLLVQTSSLNSLRSQFQAMITSQENFSQIPQPSSAHQEKNRQPDLKDLAKFHQKERTAQSRKLEKQLKKLEERYKIEQDRGFKLSKEIMAIDRAM